MKRGQSINQRGLTLLELLLVLTILGIVAVVVVPTGQPQDAEKLELATAKVVAALRHARSEALRSGKLHGMTYRPENKEIWVYQLVDPPGWYPAIDHLLYQPVTKQLAVFTLAAQPLIAGATVTSTYPYHFKKLDEPWADLVSYDIFFDATGRPIHYWQNTPVHLVRGVITLRYGSDEQRINLTPETGRVTIR